MFPLPILPPIRTKALFLSAVLLSTNLYCESVPPKTVVLSFDDAVKSHLQIVAPLLKEHGFGATFFVTHAWMNDREHFLSWEDISSLHKMGFEIGNHSWTHAAFNTPRQAARLAGELALVENELARVGVPRPITFAWTGNAFGPDSLAVLREAGYRLARRGMQPEMPNGSLELGPLFEPQRHHALLIPSSGYASPDWTPDHFKKVVDRAGPDQIAVVQFHGVPDVQHPWVHTSETSFRSYMDYLKHGGFRVIAMRDLLRWLPEKPVDTDVMAQTQYPARAGNDSYWPVEREQTLEHLGFWLPNMVYDHQFSVQEVMHVTRLPRKILDQRIADLRPASAFAGQSGRIKTLPYPGGRHPRIGFLEGAIAPQRGTKVSVFPPWNEGGYVVLDIPEAIFSNLGLLFLAHTHVPTIWNARNIVIENRDWTVEPDGSLHSEWRLPNGLKFGAAVRPEDKGVDLELWLENGTESRLSELRTQICLMLKAAPGFNEQNQERKTYDEPLAVVKARGQERFLLLGFHRCGRAWGNEKCPCVHSDPVLPSAEPGQRVSVRGHLWFYEGSDIESEKKRLLDKIGK